MSTPKSRLHAYFQAKNRPLLYSTDAIQQPAEPGVPASDIPGLVSMRTLFFCTLTLPDGSTYKSGLFSRKKEAEQDAARIALEKIGVDYSAPSAKQELVTDEEKWEALRDRITSAFSDECVLSYKPLVEHFRASLAAKTECTGQVPAAVLAALNNKILAICKALDPLSESDPVRAVGLVCKAAKACHSLNVDPYNLCISRKKSFGSHVQHELLSEDATPSPVLLEQHPENVLVQQTAPHSSNGGSSKRFEVVYIPSSLTKMVKSLKIDLGTQNYYMDAFAQELHCKHAGHVLVSRLIAKTSSGNVIRIYSEVPPSLVRSVSDSDSELDHSRAVDIGICVGEVPVGDLPHIPQCYALPDYNVRASIGTGYPVYGDAILAAVGSDWRSCGRFFCDDVDLISYYRLILSKFPQGSYKLSRSSLLGAELPTTFTSRGQWRGALPRAILTELCHQNRIAEPKFSVCSMRAGKPTKEISEIGVHTNGTVNSRKRDSHSLADTNEDQSLGPFRSTVQLTWKDGTVIEQTSDVLKTQVDAKQSASLKALHQVNSLFDATLSPVSHHHSLNVEPLDGLRFHSVGHDKDFSETRIEVLGEDEHSAKYPVAGSVVCVDYSVHLVRSTTLDKPNDLASRKALAVEAHNNFEFELGMNAVIPQMDMHVANLSVGKTVQFLTPLPAHGLLLATCKALTDAPGELHPSSLLRYTVKLVSFEEPPEERMEGAHFSPPLSRQRLNFAMNLISRSGAKSLVDLGCGSGSLLDTLIEPPSPLTKVLGVDVSHRSLLRAAKSLNSKLTKLKVEAGDVKVKNVALFEGSIAEFDCRLRCPDIAMCIEVVEHMDPEPLSKFGEVVLGQIAPGTLLVSTPNIEYNPILQGLPWTGMSDFSDTKLRNDDHRFEWTRGEFRTWADQLASQYGYGVQYSGVGGSGEDDGPGFASQIAVFTRLQPDGQPSDCSDPGGRSPYSVVYSMTRD